MLSPPALLAPRMALLLALLPFGQPLQLTPPLQVSVLEAPTPQELEACTACMVDGFWASKRLDAAQRERLAATQYADLEQRFGGDGSGRVLKGSLVAAADGGRVVGMASLELGLFDGAALSLLPRDEAAEKIVERIQDVPAAARRKPLPELCVDLFGDYARVAPLLANVAVVPGARRKGLGRRLVAACADLARDGWGYDDVLLEVECDNRPAVALYERAGFQELWRAPRAALEVDPRRESGPPLKRRDNVDHVAMRLPV